MDVDTTIQSAGDIANRQPNENDDVGVEGQVKKNS